MRLQIRYHNRFEYPEPVRESHNALRACPTTEDHQRLVSYRVHVDPPARILSYTDYWGTRVDTFGVRRPHARLLVAAESEVITSPRPQPEVDLAWEAYQSDEVTTLHYALLAPSRHTRWDEGIAELAESAVAGAGSGREAIVRLNDLVGATLEYRPGSTEVGVDVTEVLRLGRGVCQDFVHLGIAFYRSVGIPTRYVSGYFYAGDPSAGAAPETAEVIVQTHAWVEVLVPGWGWWGLDPTNHGPVGERHVKIGHGRDYDDVLPLRGVYHGDADHRLAVGVQMTREALAALPDQ